MVKSKLLLGISAFVAFLAAGQLRSTSATAADLAAVGTGAEWHNVNGDSDETGYSRLGQITAANASRLGLAWYLDLAGEASLEASPIEVNGVLYFTGSYATVYAVGAANGKLVWKFEPKTWEHNPVKMNFGFAANRGATYANGKIFSAALDGRLFALDAKTGRMIWSIETTDPKGGQTVTGAPRVFNGKVIIGQAGADFGMRGYVTAYDQETGNQVWRFYVVPASPEANNGDPAMEAAAKTWSSEFWKKTGGGGGPWDSITFDAELNRIYVGTANASPYDAEARSPGGGDNLYTASIVALDADTGKYVWHYQINPRDSWDYDCTQQMTLATLTIDGKQRKVLMQAPKNGFFYVLDRRSGKLISAEKLGKVTWAEHVDLASGRPVENPNIRYETGQSIIFPFNSGLHSWMRMAYSPATRLVYVPTMQMATRFHRGQPEDNDFNVFGLNVASVGGDPGDGKGTLVAWDPVEQKARWRVPLDTLWNGGAVSTAGNVVLQGAADGWFSAYDARTGNRLWRQNVGMGIIASPMTYSVAGKQYVAVLAGYGGSAAVLSDVMNVGWKYTGPRRLVTFALDGKAVLPSFEPPTLKVNAQDNPTEVLDQQQIAMGKAMFMACAACHGRNTVGAGGPAPDLRESPIPLSSDAFWSVVHDGTLIERGMPRFNMFGKPQIEAIRQYVRSQAQAGLATQETVQAVDPRIATALKGISPARIQANIEKLVSFGTRSTLSAQDPKSIVAGHGIGAAREWIKSQFERYSKDCGGCLEVKMDAFTQPPAERIPQPTQLTNVYAVMRGTDPEAAKRIVLVTGHYDSRATDVLDSKSAAPGANDDGSGTAVSLECARVLSKLKFHSTIIFLTVAGEEQGLNGSRHFAQMAKEQGWNIVAALNNDIVGGDKSVGQDPAVVRLFSEGVPVTADDKQLKQIRSLGGESDSPSRELARYIAEVGAAYDAGVKALLIFRLDRYLRGGDHSAFNQQGYTAVRFTEYRENFNHQHQTLRTENGIEYGDLTKFVDFDYVAKVARLNALTLAALASAPASPANVRVVTSNLDNDSTLKWEPSGDASGYEVIWRPTSSPVWEHAQNVGNVTSTTLKLSKDNVIFAVRAVDREGHRSLPVVPLPER